MPDDDKQTPTPTKPKEGRACEFDGTPYAHGETRCDKRIRKVMECRDGEWVETENNC